MTYTFKQNLVSKDKYSIKCPNTMTAEFIVVHNTANDAPAANEISYMISNNNEVSFHYAVDDKEVIQGLPVDRNAWACGDGSNGQGNRKGIQVEICYSKSGGARFENAEKNAAMFIAQLLKERGWGIDKVKKHQDFANKYCPHRTLDKGWASFINMVKDYLNESPLTPKQDIKTKACERKVKAVCDVNIWDGTDYKNVVGHVKKGEVVYFNEITEDGMFGKLGENQYISLDYNLFFMWDLWLAPIGKIQVLISQVNAYSGPDYNSKVVDHVHQHEILEFTKEENGMVLINGIGWVTLDPAMVKRVDLDQVATTYRN